MSPINEILVCGASRFFKMINHLYIFYIHSLLYLWFDFRNEIANMPRIMETMCRKCVRMNGRVYDDKFVRKVKGISIRSHFPPPLIRCERKRRNLIAQSIKVYWKEIFIK